MRLVLYAFASQGTAVLLDAPALSHQAGNTIKEMGIIYGHLACMVSHSLRGGAMRDIAHLGKDAVVGPSSDDVRKHLSHTHQTMEKGITDEYVGAIEHNYFGRRADTSFRSRLEPALAADPKVFHNTIKAPVTTKEYEEQIKTSFPNAMLLEDLTKNQKELLRSRVRASQTEKLTDSVEKAVVQREGGSIALRPDVSLRVSDEVLAAVDVPQSNSVSAGPAAPSSSGPSADVGFAKDTLQSADTLSAIDPRLLGDSVSVETSTQAEPAAPSFASSADVHFSKDTLHSADALSAIDPRLLDVERLADTLFVSSNEEEGGVEDNHGFFDASTAISPISTSDLTDANEAVAVLVNQSESTTSFESWINVYARYNIVRNDLFTCCWNEWVKSKQSDSDFAAGIGKFAERGNARDNPTPYQHPCTTPRCRYSH
ncbi:hypothetical protein DM02DRAFT_667200 [Periconia macrospinosa]|uniref:Uncharacterized protein n=1 Tax=Periconia macrospinosa TaxID=97972 RepID=A0A2V1EBB9_9PLEO|nr:hypothetical protein DM02DRAFT_667200 [Periconia macrospinosa]